MNNRLQFKKLLWTMLSVIFLTGMVGCGTTLPETEVVPTGVATNAATEAPSATPPSSITVVIPEDPPSFNALISDTGYDALVMHMVLLGMTAVNADNKVYPVLAAELPTEENGGVVENTDTGAVDVTWKMRNDVTWSDGKPVTADDVIFTYQAMIDPDMGTWF